jgi:hypothetical protein
MRRLAIPALVFAVAAALPAAAVWLATRGPGRDAPIVSDPIRDAEHTRAAARRGLDGWQWSDAEHGLVRLPIERAIERYVAAHAP